MYRIAALLLTLLLASPGVGDNPFIEKYLASAARHRELGELAESRSDIERALERDDQH
ncbi:MAG: hypothetical protein ISR76_03710, partial [Planctomycetes bacterium]|nr:hypothetical protein [Planctomycetota bacterium]